MVTSGNRPPRYLRDCLVQILVGGVNRMCGAEALGELQPIVEQVGRDDLLGSGPSADGRER